MRANIHTCVVSDQTAEGVLKMAKRFFSDPANVEKYRAWHLKEYGCLPNESTEHLTDNPLHEMREDGKAS